MNTYNIDVSYANEWYDVMYESDEDGIYILAVNEIDSCYFVDSFIDKLEDATYETIRAYQEDAKADVLMDYKECQDAN